LFQYPFTAVVGMERAKRSLLLHAIDPRIGGTLLLGHRGCAKSTLARGFAALLPPDGPKAAPFVEVPLGVTEDRLLGSIQADVLLQSGQWTPQTGLLETAHNGVLYLDEINLLADPLADLLLDSAASGVHRLERDGLSLAHNARYILVATMNPEEGDLRPQLADRFAHSVSITDAFTPEERVEIGRRRLAFDDAPEAFLANWTAPTLQLRTELAAARARLLQVQTPDALRLALAQRASAAGLEGMRAELAILRTARASASFRHASAVEPADLEEAWELCLGHRQCTPPAPPLQNRPPQPPAPDAGAQNPNTQTRPSAMSSPAPSPIPFTPADAFDSPIPLRPLLKPRILSLPQAGTQNRRLTAAFSSDRRATARLATAQLSKGPVRWQASLTASLRSGWEPSTSGAGWRWVRSCARPVRRLWALLDASRSTGAAQFLADARESLAGLFEAPLRINLLLLHKGSLRWLARNATASGARAALESLPDAAGKSPLREALLRLHRGLSATQPSAKDTVCICSDGLPTLAPGQTASQAGQRLRAAVLRLTRQQPLRTIWLSPAPARAFTRWLDTLLAGSRVELVRLAGADSR
jgi:Mg-chelatase subunit ChlI